MKIRYRPQALDDIDQIYRNLLKHSPSGALNVLRAIYAGIYLIGEQPYACQRTDDPEVRVKTVRRYRYKIFYSIIDGDTVDDHACAHTSRRPWVGS
jgi:plasmid stabilization system protein ParE